MTGRRTKRPQGETRGEAEAKRQARIEYLDTLDDEDLTDEDQALLADEYHRQMERAATAGRAAAMIQQIGWPS